MQKALVQRPAAAGALRPVSRHHARPPQAGARTCRPSMARGPSTRAASGSQQSSQTSVSVAEPAAPADVITELTVDGSSTDYNVFTSQHPVVLVDFYSDACGPCKIIYPELVKMAKEEKFGSKIKFAKFNTKTSEAHSHLAGTLGIQALPTFFVYVKGKKATQLAGADVRKLRNLAACYI